MKLNTFFIFIYFTSFFKEKKFISFFQFLIVFFILFLYDFRFIRFIKLNIFLFEFDCFLIYIFNFLLAPFKVILFIYEFIVYPFYFFLSYENTFFLVLFNYIYYNFLVLFWFIWDRLYFFIIPDSFIYSFYRFNDYFYVFFSFRRFNLKIRCLFEFFYYLYRLFWLIYAYPFYIFWRLSFILMRDFIYLLIYINKYFFSFSRKMQLFPIYKYHLFLEIFLIYFFPWLFFVRVLFWFSFFLVKYVLVFFFISIDYFCTWTRWSSRPYELRSWHSHNLSRIWVNFQSFYFHCYNDFFFFGFYFYSLFFIVVSSIYYYNNFFNIIVWNVYHYFYGKGLDFYHDRILVLVLRILLGKRVERAAYKFPILERFFLKVWELLPVYFSDLYYLSFLFHRYYSKYETQIRTIRSRSRNSLINAWRLLGIGNEPIFVIFGLVYFVEVSTIFLVIVIAIYYYIKKQVTFILHNFLFFFANLFYNLFVRHLNAHHLRRFYRNFQRKYFVYRRFLHAISFFSFVLVQLFLFFSLPFRLVFNFIFLYLIGFFIRIFLRFYNFLSRYNSICRFQFLNLILDAFIFIFLYLFILFNGILHLYLFVIFNNSLFFWTVIFKFYHFIRFGDFIIFQGTVWLSTRAFIIKSYHNFFISLSHLKFYLKLQFQFFKRGFFLNLFILKNFVSFNIISPCARLKSFFFSKSFFKK